MHEWQETKNAVRPDSNFFPLCQLSSFLSWTHVTMACYASTIDSIRYRSLSIWKKKKEEEEEEEIERGGRKKKRKSEARYVDTSLVVSFYDRYRWAAKRHTRFLLRRRKEGRKKWMRRRRDYCQQEGEIWIRAWLFSRLVRSKLETYKFTWRRYVSHSLYIW